MTYKVIVSNTELDIERGAKLSLTKENQLWQFDNFNLSRSQAIFLPATPKNNTFFGFSNNPAEYGLNARISYDAEIWYSAGKIEGKMFIIDFQMRKGYNCLFVFGELLKLKKIKEAGNIGNYLQLNNSITWNNNTPAVGALTDATPFGLRHYYVENVGYHPHLDKTKMNLMPSVFLRYLSNKCADFFDIDVNYTNAIYSDFLSVKLNGMNAQVGIGAFDNLSLDANKEFEGFNSSYWEKGTRYVRENYGPEVFGNNLPILRAKENIKVSFFFRYGNAPNPYPNSYHIHGLLIYRGDNIIYSQTIKTQNFLLDILAGDEIALFTILDLGTIYRYQRFAPDIELFRLAYTTTLDKLTYPGTYQLQPNLPAVTFIDILKVFSSISETGIYFENGTIKFFNYNFESFPEKLQVVSENLLKRSVLDYAQNNIINFASSQNVKSTSKVTKSIQIKNDSLDRERIIYTIPFSEGNSFLSGDNSITSIPDIVIKTDENGNKTYEFGQDKDTLMGTNLVQPRFITGKLSEILQNSTSIEIVAKQTLREFMQFNEFTTFLHRNKRWSWANAQWDNGLTKFEIIRIPDMITLFGYVAEVAKLKIVIENDNFSTAKSRLKFSYNNMEIFPTYDDDIDSIEGMAGRNLLSVKHFGYGDLKYEHENEHGEGGFRFRQSNGGLTKTLYENEIYTLTTKIRGEGSAIRVFRLSPLGNTFFTYIEENELDNTIFVAKTESFGITREYVNGIFIATFYNANPYTAWFELQEKSIKLEKGETATAWTPAPEDSVYISDDSGNITASIVGDELVVTAMSGNSGWVDVKYEYLNFEEIKRIEVIKN